MVRNGGMILIKPAEDYGVDLGITWTASMLAYNLWQHPACRDKIAALHISEKFNVQAKPRLAGLTKDQLPLAFGCSINTTQAYKGTVLLKWYILMEDEFSITCSSWFLNSCLYIYCRNAKYIVDSLIRMQLTQVNDTLFLHHQAKLIFISIMRWLTYSFFFPILTEVGEDSSAHDR